VGALGFNFGLQASANGVPGGSASINNAGNQVTLSLTGLRALQGGAVYQLWGYNLNANGTDNWLPIGGALTENRLVAVCASGAGCPAHDTTRDATDHPLYNTVGTVIGVTPVTSYGGSDSTREPVTGISWVLSVANGTPANPANSYHAIVLSIESAAGATTPSNTRFMWRRVQFGGGGSMSFGNFGGYDAVNTVSPRDYAFAPSGNGAATIRGDEIVANINNLSRPPIGFYYRAVLQDSVGNEVFVDTLRSAYSAQAALNRISLADADFNTELPTVSRTEIKAASIRNCITGSTEIGCPSNMALDPTAKFGPISQLLLTIEAKRASSNLMPGLLVGHGVVLAGLVPDPAKK
jgi:hypothetical protein